jgi:hypothetical protein
MTARPDCKPLVASSQTLSFQRFMCIYADYEDMKDNLSFPESRSKKLYLSLNTSQLDDPLASGGHKHDGAKLTYRQLTLLQRVIASRLAQAKAFSDLWSIQLVTFT